MSDKTTWQQLAEPFAETEVKKRPGAAKWDHKPSCEKERCRETRDETKHHQFAYVDARTVAQRLDEVLTPEGWDFTCTVLPGTDIVKGTLTIGVNVREDHGYPNSDRDEEPIKAATSDALKRCAVLFGIGRHLYDDNTPISQARGVGGHSGPPRASQSPRPVSPPAPAGASNPDEPPFPGEVIGFRQPAAVLPDPRDGFYGDTCPVHQGRPWKETPRGIKCTANNGTRENPDFCTWKPNKRWLAEHELDTAAR